MSADSYGQIKRIYDSLADKKSQLIFEKRFMYSLSGDLKYIYEMVISEMKHYGNGDIMLQALAWIDCQQKPVVIFGAGFAGLQIASILLYLGKEVRCFIDNNKKLWGKQKQGVTICASDILPELEECCVIIGTNSCISEIKGQLLSLGVDETRIFVPEKLWWLGKEVQYFDRDIMKPRMHEVFVDGGALDGGDSNAFMEWCGGNFDKIYMFEPDEKNYEKMRLRGVRDRRIESFEEGLWSRTDKLRFLEGARESSTVSKNGNVMIQVTSIDEKLKDVPVTMIKMDIEGCELEALKGTEETVRRYRPRLAVCVYHKPEDIVEIPLKILGLNPDYRLYLRHYSYVETETVLYAI